MAILSQSDNDANDLRELIVTSAGVELIVDVEVMLLNAGICTTPSDASNVSFVCERLAMNGDEIGADEVNIP